MLQHLNDAVADVIMLQLSRLEGSSMIIASKSGFVTDLANSADGEEDMYKELFKATVERSTIEESNVDLVNLDLTSIGREAYAYHEHLGQINLPNVSRIEREAFYGSKIHGDIRFPEATYLGYHAFSEFFFYGNEIRLPSITSLVEGQFYQGLQGHRMLSTGASLYLDSCLSFNSKCLYNCNGLVKLYAPNTTSITGGDAFAGIAGSRNFVNNVSLIVGSQELNSGLSMSELCNLTNFPFGITLTYLDTGDAYSRQVTWYCKDGTVTYNHATSAWT